ncbi:hypothetical protein SJAG_03178 [Schizosaccharomyces japonicus yFS275]|uniref:Extracellular membrane protein CFEM domain-containing protein n=1 Tax=Schizosaccharomyces japonicus (strain yFS275 / FY16936) TaxID=402676 RepID=B6K3J2_SCHJY|nr:hypothetical protein SJAG_03178 [Schizosaccharomyces japonicus yFS275]EEB08049.1 hypothetical protein SJAG_03178 [Schizosaccharomyces japonicus yFS275]
MKLAQSIALFSLAGVALATPPACVLACLEGSTALTDFSSLCTSTLSSCLNEKCSDVSAAVQYASEVCTANGHALVNAVSSSSSGYSASSTSYASSSAYTSSSAYSSSAVSSIIPSGSAVSSAVVSSAAAASSSAVEYVSAVSSAVASSSVEPVSSAVVPVVSASSAESTVSSAVVPIASAPYSQNESVTVPAAHNTTYTILSTFTTHATTPYYANTTISSAVSSPTVSKGPYYVNSTANGNDTWSTYSARPTGPSGSNFSVVSNGNGTIPSSAMSSVNVNSVLPVFAAVLIVALSL